MVALDEIKLHRILDVVTEEHKPGNHFFTHVYMLTCRETGRQSANQTGMLTGKRADRQAGRSETVTCSLRVKGKHMKMVSIEVFDVTM